ncbi:protein Shroom3 [Acomys russatus]|uniref:protein Shroom3 n=1 Tax=Acomys russatus TaxID=60746 RepID=UPI0021E20C3E|nr:protein Shroom3 [Acomys russatus]
MVRSKGCLALVLPRFGTQRSRKQQKLDVCADPGHADPGASNSLSSELLNCGPQHRKATWSGGVKLRLKQRCSEPAARPHSWHTTKRGENQPDASMMQISQGTVGPPWHQSYHSSSSTSDLSNYDHVYLRRSPDQCSSPGSMESLEPSAGYPHCHLLSPAKSTSSIDQLGHLHNKRDSAYSSFSTSSSLLEYPPPGGSGRERSGSMDTIPARGSLLEGMRQADIRYVKTVYDTRRGVSSEYEVNPSALLLQGRDGHASAGSQGCAKWHSVPRGKGTPSPSWMQECASPLETATDNLPHKVGAPMPPTRSDSFAAFRHRDRPSSWSSLDQKRFCRPLTNSSGPLKTPFMEEQLHPVPESSPENSPPVKPKHNYTQKTQPGQPLLPTGIYPVPSAEPRFAQVPQPSVGSNGTVYPALVKESGYSAAQGACNKMAALDENGNQSEASRPGFAFCQPLEHDSVTQVERKPEPTAKYVPYKVHFSSVPENEDSSLRRHVTPPQGNSPYPGERKNAHGSRLCSNHHSASAPQAQALRVGDDGRPSRLPQPWEGDLQEDQNANLRQKPEREGHGQSLSGNFGRTKSAFSSLQNIPESLKRQSSIDLGGEAQEVYPGGRSTYALSTKVEDPGRKAGPDSRGCLDRSVSCPRPEGRRNVAASLHGADSRYEEPPDPQLQHTSGPGQRRLSASSASALQYRKPHCSVLEKVSKIEEREQGRHRLPSVGSSAYGPNYRSSRTGPTPSTSNSDFEDPKPSSIHFSESTEHLRNGEQNLKNEGEEVSWQQCGQQLWRAAADGHGPPPVRGSEPPRPDGRLLRSQSTFQLFSEAEREASWSEDRPSTPESPLLDVPFSRAYRNSIKDAQSRVLGATSFRRRDLEPGTPATSRPWRPRPASAHMGMRSPEAAAPSSSPHTPRERHSVTPAAGTQPAPQAARRGARRRLTPEQKKRSYSEPEKMNEVGVSEEAEPAPCDSPRPAPLRFSESTVADRRRIFERDSKACSTLSLSGPELKQFQQSALADYIQRKTGKRPASAACPQEPGLRERAQSAYLQAGPAANEGPSLASASSLSSLREPEALPRKEHPNLSTADAPQVPRDRSSSFASGHLVGERRRWDPQVSRQLPSGATGGPRGVQRIDRTPSGPPSWGMVAAKAGKSKSAEDLLERSDTLAVPVHVRSRSSPTSDKKGQDVLPREDSGFGFVKDPCCLAGPGCRSLSCSDRGQKEQALPLHHPTPCWNDLGFNATVGSSVPTECSGAPDHHPKQLRTPCSRPLPAGTQGHFPDARAASVAPLSSAQPSPVPSSYCSQLAVGQPTERSGQTGRQPLPSPASAVTHRYNGHSLTQPPSPRYHEVSSPEHGLEEGMWKRASLPQRPPPPWVKWAHAVREDGLSEDALSPEIANRKHYRSHQSLPSSCSTSDPDTPGRISLRISESALQTSPPPRGDYEDEVFMKDSHPKVTSSSMCETLPPPPPPPPPPSEENLANGSDDFPPPPPQAVCEALLDSEAYMEPGSSTSCRLPRVTATSKGHTSGAAHHEGSQGMPATPPQTLAKGLEAKSNSPCSENAQPLPTSALGEQPSPCQARNLDPEPVGRTQDPGKKIHAGPQKTSEDIRTEALAKEIIHQDKSLADILDPDSRMKTTMDLMEGLFPGDSKLGKESGIKKKALEMTARHSGCEAKTSDDKEAVGALVSCPAYYSVSAAKAELLNKIKDMPEMTPEEEEEQEDVNEKKAELIGSLTHKLETLQEAKGSLLMDIKLNNALGEEVEALISKLCKPNEFDKYKMFIGDLDKVVNLLLSLSGRLARVENVLSGLGEDASKEERSSLTEKRKVLAGQHEDARELKDNLDRRERVVLDILASYLSAEQLQDYQHFVKMKSTLLIEQRKLDDKIKLGQEQVKCLLESLPSDFRPKAGAISLPAALTSPVAPGGGSAISGIFPTLTSPL